MGLTRTPTRPIITVRGLHFHYSPHSERPVHALRGIDLDIHAGDYLVIIGHNGSGKSTLAQHLNALLRPSAGEVQVGGLDTRDPANTIAIRRSVGMVFQVPDNQIVATVVEEDVAFGPENLGVAAEELHRRVEWALDVVDLLPYRHRAPHRLSAGQKQRVALAGVIAMQPEVIVLDEATSMLDPEGRREVLAVIRRLNDQGVTVVAITHNMEEAAEGDRVVVMEEGRVVLEGPPRQVFRRVQELRELHLDVPQTTRLAYRLHEREVGFPPDLISVEEVVGAVEERRPTLLRGVIEEDEQEGLSQEPRLLGLQGTGVGEQARGEGEALIAVHDLHHTYLRGTPLEAVGLRGASLEVYRGEALGILGRTGSGKSTLVQHLNGLLRPREPGRVRIDGQDLADPRVDVRRIRQRIGLVFQYPEQQLFEKLVGDDVAFGLKKLDLPRPERRERVQWALEMVGLDFEAFKDRFTFSLSGGERRKVALAGVLALEPEVLILDESTTGLDPRSRRDLLDRLLALHQERGLTLVFVSPSMEEVAELVQRVYVLDEGRVAMSGTTREVFGQPDALREHGLGIPLVTQVAYELQRRGAPIRSLPVTVAEGVDELWRILNSSAT